MPNFYATKIWYWRHSAEGWPEVIDPLQQYEYRWKWIQNNFVYLFTVENPQPLDFQVSKDFSSWRVIMPDLPSDCFLGDLGVRLGVRVFYSSEPNGWVYGSRQGDAAVTIQCYDVDGNALTFGIVPARFVSVGELGLELTGLVPNVRINPDYPLTITLRGSTSGGYNFSVAAGWGPLILRAGVHYDPSYFTTDVLLGVEGVETSHHIDAYIVKLGNVEHSTDCLVLKSKKINHAIDSDLKGEVDLGHTTNTLIVFSYQLDYQTDSFLSGAVEVAYTTDSDLKGESYSDHYTDSLIRGSVSLQFTTDAQLSKTRGVAHTTTSYLTATATLSHSTTSYVTWNFTCNFSSNAYLQGSPTRAYLTDADLSGFTVKIHRLDSYLSRESKLSLYELLPLIIKIRDKEASGGVWAEPILKQIIGCIEEQANETNTLIGGLRQLLNLSNKDTSYLYLISKLLGTSFYDGWLDDFKKFATEQSIPRHKIHGTAFSCAKSLRYRSLGAYRVAEAFKHDYLDEHGDYSAVRDHNHPYRAARVIIYKNS